MARAHAGWFCLLPLFASTLRCRTFNDIKSHGVVFATAQPEEDHRARPKLSETRSEPAICTDPHAVPSMTPPLATLDARTGIVDAVRSDGLQSFTCSLPGRLQRHSSTCRLCTSLSVSTVNRDREREWERERAERNRDSDRDHERDVREQQDVNMEEGGPKNGRAQTLSSPLGERLRAVPPPLPGQGQGQDRERNRDVTTFAASRPLHPSTRWQWQAPSTAHALVCSASRFWRRSTRVTSAKQSRSSWMLASSGAFWRCMEWDFCALVCHSSSLRCLMPLAVDAGFDVDIFAQAKSMSSAASAVHGGKAGFKAGR
ncbi:hypothetical protein FA95DRAFT_1573564 [Auriscalpium vulgare]|uniref:Uncharacterized protein n=1 Tax=Auriscalpium vulgare TaxID=40419 RepID=A0ACB8RPA8_9AGAM|nr:hypothetical protein FA95DRAFT_1573564 [Auriscalpium vulgare]